MLIIWGMLLGQLLYLELIFHICSFGWNMSNPVFAILFSIAWSGGQALVVGLVKGRWKKVFFYGFIWLSVLWVGVQLVYFRIFRQPLLWEAVFKGGSDALTNYWREALAGVLGALPYLLLLLLPAVAIGMILHKIKWHFPRVTRLEMLRTGLVTLLGLFSCLTILEIGKFLDTDFYQDYHEFYNPLGVTETTGVFPTLLRDTIHFSVNNLLQVDSDQEEVISEDMILETQIDTQTDSETDTEIESEIDSQIDTDSDHISQPHEDEQIQYEENKPEQNVPVKHEYELDYEVLRGLADNKKKAWLADYIQGLQPTYTNEYTGIFEGYNLIYLTAEGFCSYAIREDVTPTLYKLTHSGFTFENYYVPLWQTSTSDGEYINCTGLIPDGQFSMRKSGSNNMAYSLPAFFSSQNVKSYAYHNNTLSYYDRNVTHPNLGYDFKGCKLGGLSAEVWGKQIFPMEHPNQWPASDLEMIQGTVPEYINEERFHVYYMTVSGHMNYNFKGNAMASKNRKAVENMELSENGKAYIACNIELDKALECLLEQLQAAGQLEKTVICLSADHYPYGMTNEQYEELAGKSLSEGMDLYRNSLILWNAGMEDAVHVTKACGPMDIIPTLLNLFGFSFDSRMYAGRDILSEEEGLVIFNDRSFVTDSVIYNRKKKQTIWLKDDEGMDIVPDDEKESYLSDIRQEVKDRYQFSAYVLQENYYQDVEDARKCK